MEQRPPLRRRRPQPEPGPRLLPIAVAVAVVGFALGAGGKLLFAHMHHAAPAATPHTTPSPNYALLAAHAQATKLPPIPTPQGTWLTSATTQPFHVLLKPVVVPTHTVAPTATPRPAPTPPALPSPVPNASTTPIATAKPIVVKRKPSPRRSAHKKKLLPVPTAKPTIAATIAPAVAPTIASTPSPSPVPTVAVTPKPRAAAPVRVVRRYLTSLIRGDESTAYALLGAAPGDKNAGLSEELFINTSARITALSSTPDASGSIVHAEIQTAGGLYFGTYHVDERGGELIITSHDFIKL